MASFVFGFHQIWQNDITAPLNSSDLHKTVPRLDIIYHQHSQHTTSTTTPITMHLFGKNKHWTKVFFPKQKQTRLARHSSSYVDETLPPVHVNPRQLTSSYGTTVTVTRSPATKRSSSPRRAQPPTPAPVTPDALRETYFPPLRNLHATAPTQPLRVKKRDPPPCADPECAVHLHQRAKFEREALEAFLRVDVNAPIPFTALHAARSRSGSEHGMAVRNVEARRTPCVCTVPVPEGQKAELMYQSRMRPTFSRKPTSFVFAPPNSKGKARDVPTDDDIVDADLLRAKAAYRGFSGRRVRFSDKTTIWE